MDYLTTYLKTLELNGEYSKNTVQAYKSDLKRFFIFLERILGREPSIEDITSDVIKEFLNSERSLGFSSSTVHRRKVVLSQFVLYLSKTGSFSRKELLEVLKWKRTLWKEIYSREIKYLSDKDLRILFKTIGEENSAKAIRDISLISLLIETGLPISRIVQINLGDLDLDKKLLYISMKRKLHTFDIGGTTEFLQTYLTIGRKEFTQSTSENALFVSQLGARISRQGVWQLVKDWGEKAKLNDPVSPRILRNTKIRKMVLSGHSTAEIQNQLGHSNRYSTRALVRKINRNI